MYAYLEASALVNRTQGTLVCHMGSYEHRGRCLESQYVDHLSMLADRFPLLPRALRPNAPARPHHQLGALVVEEGP